MHLSFVRPGNIAQAITGHVQTLQQFASEVVSALRETTDAERDRRRFGERS